jgi:murein DD-endopeptidase / murein LD-carboxypeptidase
MIKNLLATTIIIFCLAAFLPADAQKNSRSGGTSARTEIKFLDDIVVGVDAPAEVLPVKSFRNTIVEPIYNITTSAASNAIEAASSLQFKFSLLLNTEVELIKNITLFNLIDEWLGTPYRYGGSTKKGIDCSAFVQLMYAGLFGVTLPRTAREQFGATEKISKKELQEGDLIFFNTRGGVSHVGFYLQNNKFVHAASSGGVMISDLDEEYWDKRLIGVRRHQSTEATASL